MATIYQWQDITSQILEATKQLKLFQTITIPDFNMEDSMQANEINDMKIDAKSDIGPQCTLNYLLENKIILHPNQIKLQQIISIYDEILGYQILCLKGQPLSQSIYTFPYLYDKSLSKDNPYLLALIQSINNFGNYASEVIKIAYSTKQDDINFSIFSYSSQKKTSDQMIQILLKLQKQLQQQRNKSKISNKTLNVYDALISRIRFRRFLHILLKSLGSKFDVKNSDKISKDVESCRKKLEQLKKYQSFYKKSEKIFNSEIFKSLRAHISPRKIVYPENSSTFKQLQNFFDQINLFIPIPKYFSEILQKFEILAKLPLNILSKSYLISNFFSKQQHLLNYQPTVEVVINDIIDWTSIKQNITKNNQKFLILAKHCSTLVSEILYKHLANKMRWYWQTSKLYQQLNILVHYANEFDQNHVENKKQFLICSWVYYVGINNMIKQLHTGIQIELYYPVEYPYIFFYFQYLLNIVEKNSMTFLSKFDSAYIKFFNQKSLNNKRKKNISPNARKMFSYNIYHKGLLYYYRALSKLLFIFMQHGALKNDFKQNEKQRFQGRFKIFKKIIFLKGVDYSTYKSERDSLQNPQNYQKALITAEQNLKQAKNIFQSLQILQSNTDIIEEYKKNSEQLVKICIRLSLQVMKFKMKKESVANLKFVTNYGYFPQFTF